MALPHPATPRTAQHQASTSRSLGPPQYAFAVRLNPSQHASLDAGYQPSPGGGPQISTTSEHMLRRKTPNGTLAAGYDGTPVQWSTKPPPTKHMVLPLSNLSTEEHPTVIEHQYGALYNQGSNDSSHSYQQPPRTQSSSLTNGFWDTSGGNGAWRRIPSVFLSGQGTDDGVTMHQGPAQFMYNGMQVPTVLQPPYQPCLGPTASNDTGIYGPYYADGRFEAYRPAAVRDTGYHAFNPCPGPFQGISPSNHLFAGTEQYPNSHSYNSSPFFHQPDPRSWKDQSGQASGFFSNSEAVNQEPIAHPTNNVNLSSQHLNSGYYQTPLGPRSHNAQFKEKVLGWAHTIYVDLLASIHQSKKEAYHARKKQGLQRSYSQTSIYPRPPRQSAFVFRRPSDPAYHSDGMSRNHSHDFGHISDSASGSDAYRRRSNSLVSIMEDKRSFATRTSPSRQSIDRPYFIPNHHGTGQGHSPSSLYLHAIPQRGSVKDTAKSALEILGNLCQESGWRWIDGMLLGGCLAYGLEEYDKALEWYSKIIALDSR